MSDDIDKPENSTDSSTDKKKGASFADNCIDSSTDKPSLLGPDDPNKRVGRRGLKAVSGDADSTDPHVVAACREYLLDRGLTLEQAQHLGMRIVGQTLGLKLARLATDALGAKNWPFDGGIWIPHGGEQSPTGQLVGPEPLRQQAGATFEGVKPVPNKRNTRGAQQLWMGVDREYEQDDTVYLCESAVKAAVMWRCGYRAVAGAGVASIWTEARGFIAGWGVIDGLLKGSQITRVRVLFDTDLSTNPNVKRAVEGLTGALTRDYPGRRVEVIDLDPEKYGEKVGIDDVVAEYEAGGGDGVELLASLLGDDSEAVADSSAVVDERQALINYFNSRFVKVREPATAVTRASGFVEKFGELRAATCHKQYRETTSKGKGKVIYGADAWLESGQAETVQKIDYMPGHEMVVLADEHGQGGFFNTWQDTGCASVAGSIQPLVDMLDNALGAEDGAEVRSDFLDSMAWIMQNRSEAEKLPRTICAVGVGQGTGKSSLAEMMGAILGKSNFKSIDADTITRQFNSQYCSSEMVLLDDVINLNAATAARLKSLATGETVVCDQKGIPAYEVQNHMVFFLTANTLQALPLEPGDRRALVMVFNPTVRWTAGGEEWEAYFKWLYKSGGVEAVRHHLEHRDISAFNHRGMPYDSLGKRETIAGGLDPVDEFIIGVKEDLDEMLGEGACRVASLRDIWTYIWGDEPADQRALTALGKRLASHLPKVAEGKRIRVGGKVHNSLRALAPHQDGPWTLDRVKEELERAEHEPS